MRMEASKDNGAIDGNNKSIFWPAIRVGDWYRLHAMRYAGLGLLDVDGDQARELRNVLFRNSRTICHDSWCAGPLVFLLRNTALATLGRRQFSN